jgi:hypothetical protein
MPSEAEKLKPLKGRHASTNRGDPHRSQTTPKTKAARRSGRRRTYAGLAVIQTIFTNFANVSPTLRSSSTSRAINRTWRLNGFGLDVEIQPLSQAAGALAGALLMGEFT